MSETSVAVTVRYFAAARAASGVDEEVLTLAEPATVGTAMEAAVAHHGADLERVLTRCSFLLNTVAVRDTAQRINPNDQVDVLPPFAGG